MDKVVLRIGCGSWYSNLKTSNFHSPNANCWTSDGKVAENMSVCLFSFEGIEECSHILTISGRKPANKKIRNIPLTNLLPFPNEFQHPTISRKNWGKNREIVWCFISAIFWIILKLTTERIKQIYLPISNIRSASSRTRNFKFSKEILSFSTKSMRRPGVLKIIATLVGGYSLGLQVFPLEITALSLYRSKSFWSFLDWLIP